LPGNLLCSVSRLFSRPLGAVTLNIVIVTLFFIPRTQSKDAKQKNIPVFHLNKLHWPKSEMFPFSGARHWYVGRLSGL